MKLGRQMIYQRIIILLESDVEVAHEMAKKRNPNRPSAIRSLGFTTMAMDAPTKKGIKQLAGETPMAHYLRDLIKRELTTRSMTP